MLNINQYPTYRCCSLLQAPGATPDDLFTITGSSTANIYVQKMGISSVQTTAGVNEFFIAKRSTDNVGGTAVIRPEVPLQSGSPAATAVVRAYTAVPTSSGTLVGYIWDGMIATGAVASTGISGYQGIEVDFETMYGQPVGLLSAAQVLSWSWGAGAIPAGFFYNAWVQWFEMSKSS